MMEQIGKLKVGDRFTETESLAILTQLFTVERFLDNGLVVARDANGWARCFDETDMVFPCVRITQTK